MQPEPRRHLRGNGPRQRAARQRPVRVAARHQLSVSGQRVPVHELHHRRRLTPVNVSGPAPAATGSKRLAIPAQAPAPSGTGTLGQAPADLALRLGELARRQVRRLPPAEVALAVNLIAAVN